MKKISAWKTKGMNRDLSVSAFNPEFSFENMNLRLSTNEGNTLLSWVNEKSTHKIGLYKDNSPFTIPGSVIGTAVLGKYLVLFTTNIDTSYTPYVKTDYIYRLEYIGGISLSLAMSVTLLYSGNLGFDITKPLETLSIYEREDIQKVYWTDGVTQPKVINIVKAGGYGEWSEDTTYNPFDFVPELQLSENVKVTKILGASGMFASGVIQYALTYYNKYGQESNIFYTSPLLYISHKDRGASPEERVENAFKITVSSVDRHFQFIRVYSIQRTNINGTPICKRVQDIDITDRSTTVFSYIDTGTSGNTIDPTELLYKGGDPISVNTMKQKDDTLFFGGIKLSREQIIDAQNNPLKTDIEGIEVTTDTRDIYPEVINTSDYIYSNQLTTSLDSNKTQTVPCGGFKRGDYYRCGLQFQHKSGKWSDPIFINSKNDVEQDKYPQENHYNNSISLPIFKAEISQNIAGRLIAKGYKKVRPVIVFPELQDRVNVCQCVACPTLFTTNHREAYSSNHQNATNDLYAQSSWFFRPLAPTTNHGLSSSGAVAPEGAKDDSFGNLLPYTSRIAGNGIPVIGNAYNPNGDINNIRRVEIWGDYDDDNKMRIDKYFLTLHSPDVEFDDRLSLVDYSSAQYILAGNTVFQNTFSDMELQTETPTISAQGSGFVYRPSKESGIYGIVSGLFYDDFVVDEDKNNSNILEPYPKEHSTVKWMVHLWHKNGSLNNDINRPADKGARTAVLKKKVVSNLRYADTNLTLYASQNAHKNFITNGTPQMFNSTQVTVAKLGNKIYQGNIDTLVMPDHPDGNYFAFENTDIETESQDTSFNANILWKTFNKKESQNASAGLWYYSNSLWTKSVSDIGDAYLDLVLKKEAVRIKYKSTAHLVCEVNSSDSTLNNIWHDILKLPVLDITKPIDHNSIFGGKSNDAIKENIWIPCGEPVSLSEDNDTPVKFEYGDTYYQRWDCLKTYPFTKEDVNQVVEIGSFMLETRINIDGRYDRNRGQTNNLNMSPENFNLLNPVYSQADNFFSYRIQDDDYYTSVIFPNQIAWSKTKTSGSDVDAWTNMSLGSSLEMDGDKGKITKLARLNDRLLCFQNKGISQILYNENVQISSTDGVPIEIANSGKVMGKKYISDTVGCSNKWTVCNTPNGIYFMDSNEQSIYLFNGELKNISQQFGFNTWCKKNIPTPINTWHPGFPAINSRTAFTACYDRKNQDVLFINADTALAWNEKFGAFTSFYDYGGTQFFCNIEDTGVWIKKMLVDNSAQVTLWKHQAGNSYCSFFEVNKPYWMTLVGNPEPQMDKIFTNMEFRACVEGDGELNQNTGKFTFTLPFNSLETWNEYQHGYTTIENKSGHSAMVHDFASSSLKRKFRIWRCDIPRNNTVLDTNRQQGTTYPYSTDAALGVSRYIVKPNDRMRNPWLYLKLFKTAAVLPSTLPKIEIHDLVMTYFD